jgi:signal transduction histidine kinase
MYESLELKRLEISLFFESFLSMVKNDFQTKGIAIDCVIEPEARFLYADPRALQQVLLNILTNAADALAGREQPRIHILVSESAGNIRLRIEDNGKGIEETRLKQLFKPFYTTKAHGTGLGLVIIRKMIAKMRGTVEITSSSNVGTIVVLHLPSTEN